MSLEDPPGETISLPSIAIVTILGYLLYRYFFSPSSSSPTNASASGSGAPRYRFTPTQVDTVSTMFPQLSRRDIMWDLQRNGGSVQATTERILGGRGLDMAPPSFQPNIGNPPTTNNTTQQSGGVTALLRNATRKEEIDLITRYNLQNRVKSADKGKAREDINTGAGTGRETTTTTNEKGVSASESRQQQSGWAATKDARQGILQRRRDEMILEARRRMLEKDAAGGSTGGSGGI